MLLTECTYLYSYILPFYSFLAKLIELLEVLVGHSISSVELKSFLRLLAPNKNQQLPGYAHMMQRTLVNVAVKDTHNLPLHSIDLNAAESVSHNFTCILLCKIMLLVWLLATQLLKRQFIFIGNQTREAIKYENSWFRIHVSCVGIFGPSTLLGSAWGTEEENALLFWGIQRSWLPGVFS